MAFYGLNVTIIHMKNTILYLVTGVIALWFITQTLYPASQTITHGFAAYYSAARLLQSGQLDERIYDPAYFRPIVQADSQGQADDIYNANPPTTALLLWPLSFFSLATARVIWIWANGLILWGGLALLACMSAPPPRWPVWAGLLGLGTFFQPALENIYYGQAYLLIFLLLTLAFAALLQQRPWLTGLALTLALLLKTAGWALWPLLLWQRRWRTLAWAMGSLGLSFILTLPLFPPRMWLQFLTLLSQTSRSPQTCVTAYQTTWSLLCRTFVFDPLWSPAPLLHLPWLATVLWAGFALTTAALIFNLSQRSLSRGWLAMIAWGVLFAPLGEQYHHTVLLLPLGWLLIQESQHSFGRSKIAIPGAPKLPFSRQNMALSLQNLNMLSLGHHLLLLIPICLYVWPLPAFQELHGWRLLLAYPRVYGAWLILGLLFWGYKQSSPGS